MRVMLLSLIAATLLCTSVSARAVNISNTWMLPEEGFPVFYRYFRDRISWNEADAVCQFHHANLVTVDSTSQYDAIRAYLKELDIANNVWIGLTRAADKQEFTWRDFRDLSALDHWQEEIPAVGSESLCAAMDPAADFRWHALTCGGPEAASFICELPVPAWADGSDGCLITELPSLTVLYIPEQSAVELTSDCGLEGTKRIICKGKGDRDELIRRLACTDDSIAVESKTQSPTPTSHVGTSPASITVKTTLTKTTKPLIWTSNTIDTGDYGVPTRHRRETEQTSVSPTTDVPATLGTTSQRPVITSGASTESESTPLLETNPEEFASAINQGQLFSIIENGTLFDIIELNGTDENKTLAPDTTRPTEMTNKITPTQSANINKEAIPDVAIPANANDLHRTFRKQVPIFPKPDHNFNIDVTNDIQTKENDHDNENLNDKMASLIVSAVKEMALAAETVTAQKEKMANRLITSKSTDLDTDKVLDKLMTTPAMVVTERVESTDDTKFESEPTTKPNRQRQLTRSNRRSFYPYFFSRVLG